MVRVPNNGDSWRSVGASVVELLGRMFTDACENPWHMTVADEASEMPTDGSACVCFQLSFRGSIQGEATLIIEHISVQLLGLRNVAKGDGSFTEEHEGALLDALRGISPEFQNLLHRYGEVELEVATSALPEKLPDGFLPLWLHTEEEKSKVPMFLQFDAAMIEALESSSITPLSYPTPNGQGATNLGLVMDVALNVTLRFGQRRLALREVLDLTSGSVVELDRQVDEPVELVLDGRVVARGEAVIIDGNYGIRITKVLQPMIT